MLLCSLPWQLHGKKLCIYVYMSVCAPLLFVVCCCDCGSVGVSLHNPLPLFSTSLLSRPIQKFTIAPDPLGITRVGDLSAEDMKKVRRLAFIELTSTFDQHGLALRMPKAEKVKSVKGESIL